MTTAVRERILVVDDDSDILELLRIRFSAEGFQVHTEERGLSALKYAETTQPDLVILDLRLPDIHGHEVCQKLREMTSPRYVPVIMLTGMSRPMDQLRGFSFGADAYLTKPYRWEELLNTVQVLLGYREV